MLPKTGLLLLLSLALPGVSTSLAQEGSDWSAYEPNPIYPVGRRNPAAPVELEQFAFMLGACDCVDRIRGADGSWTTTQAIWNATYFLNGWGIQDVYWSETFATTNLRIYDPEEQLWRVNFYRMPTSTIGAGQWTGREEPSPEGRRMVMWAGSPDRRNGSRLTFSAIGEEGFEWVAETLQDGAATPSWTSSCRRRGTTGPVKTPAFQGYEPSSAFPFGQRHPQAPEGLRSMGSWVGAFDWSAAEARDGRGRMVSRYVLNGWGIQMRTWAEESFETSLWLFDPSKERWHVSTFRMPGYDWQVWEGELGEGFLSLERQARNGRPAAEDRVWTWEGGARSFETYEESAGGELRTLRFERRP